MFTNSQFGESWVKTVPRTDLLITFIGVQRLDNASNRQHVCHLLIAFTMYHLDNTQVIRHIVITTYEDQNSSLKTKEVPLLGGGGCTKIVLDGYINVIS